MTLAQCVEVDPENPLCQVLGKYSLRLDSQPGVPPRYNYVEVHADFGQVSMLTLFIRRQLQTK